MQKDDALRRLRDPGRVLPEKQTLLSNIAAQAEALRMPCYIVGGFVRDLLLGAPINDLDIVVEGDAITLGKKLVETYGGKLTPHFKFHTAIWHIPATFNLQPATLDLITARKETYERPGVLPTVTPATLEDDLRRRDFPMNSMAIRLDGEHFGELLDPLHGTLDLENKLIRVLHAQSFMDDPTRIFRAIRYQLRYAFNLEPATLSLINAESLSTLAKLSGERIRHELDLIFEEERAAEIMRQLNQLGVVTRIYSALPDFNPSYDEVLEMDATLDVPANRISLGYILWFVNLTEDEIFAIAARLGFSNEQTLDVWSAAQLKRSLPYLLGSKPSEWAYALEKLPLLSIYAIYLISGEKALLDYISFWRHVKPYTTGEQLKAQGLAPGPRFGEILGQLRTAWLDGALSSKTQEEALLQRLIAETNCS
ncbi:MAG: CCA tRNA nucleotidyltransferase [Anaerolineales bacterium]|nr:CCA tRNA nucleotidyltransferase [Anaerolineales bacterium]